MSSLSDLSRGKFVTVARADDVGEGSMLGVAVAGLGMLLVASQNLLVLC